MSDKDILRLIIAIILAGILFAIVYKFTGKKLAFLACLIFGYGAASGIIAKDNSDK